MLNKRANTCKVRAYVFQCRDLPAADDDGLCDPFVQMFKSLDTEEKKKGAKAYARTAFKTSNCDPMFYEILELDIDFTPGQPLPPFIIDIYDVDQGLMGKSFDYLGRALLFEKDVSIMTIGAAEDKQYLKPPDPKWHDIRYSQESPPCGKILVSFVRTEDFDYNFMTPTS